MSAAARPRGRDVPEVLVARQPILDRALEPQAYELLCRPPAGARSPGADAGQATAAAIARSLLTLGPQAVTAGKPAHVNVGAALLRREELAALPPGVVVLELDGDVDASDPALAGALRALRDRGFRLLLDGLARADDPRLGLLADVDAAKLDFAASDAGARRDLAARVRSAGAGLLAGGVATRAQVGEAFALGCDRVQGDFLAEPLVLSRPQPPGFKPTHARLVEAVLRDELDFAELERIIKTDLLLSHQFLRYINVAGFGWRRTITSLRHAFVLLGEHPVRQWVCLVVMADLAQDRPQQLAVTACLRARFCELLGAHARGFSGRGLDLFLLGMFSVIDAVLHRPMVAALSGMPLPPAVTAALLGHPTEIGGVLEVVRAYERGDWPALERACAAAGIAEDALMPAYLDAVEWVSATFDDGEAGGDAAGGD